MLWVSTFGSSTFQEDLGTRLRDIVTHCRCLALALTNICAVTFCRCAFARKITIFLTGFGIFGINQSPPKSFAESQFAGLLVRVGQYWPMLPIDGESQTSEIENHPQSLSDLGHCPIVNVAFVLHQEFAVNRDYLRDVCN